MADPASDPTSSTGSGPLATSPLVPIPDHELLRCIGRGSYGEVWLARNQMGIYRAVKIVHRSSFQDDRPFQRELSGIRKFEPISRSHEGFVDVLHVGINEKQGYFYYVMELGDDPLTGPDISPNGYSPKTLARQILSHGRLPARACLELALGLTQALAELHKHGLVHRDIKPSNIIFVNGRPKLADIGLVAQIDEAQSFVGTSGFIPPEGPGSPAADIYSLGKVLYEAATGKDRQEFPHLPPELDKFPDHQEFIELNEIILHACQNDPAKRYPTAWEMHAELVALANGRSIRRLRVLERRMARLKRLGLVSLVTTLVVAALLYPVYQQWRNAIESRQRQVGADVTYGIRLMDSGDLLGALPWFADALRLDQGNPQREGTHRLRLGAVLAQCPKLTSLWSLGGNVNAGQFSPDGKHVLIARYFGTAGIYDLTTGAAFLHPFGQAEGLCDAAYSPDGRRIVTASQDSTACVWDAATLEPIFPLPHADRVLSARFSPDGRYIVTACSNGTAIIWDATTGRRERELKQHSDIVRFAAFSPDGRLVVSASQDSTAQVWTSADGRPLGPPLAHLSWVMYAAFSPDGRRLVTACADHKARVWEVGTGRQILPDLDHDDAVRSAEFSPDGRLIVTAGYDGTVRLWRAASLRPMGAHSVLRHGEPVNQASFSRDGRLILTTGVDGSVRVWDLAGSAMSPIPLQGSFSLDGARFLTRTNNHITVWDTKSARPVSAFALPGRNLKIADLNRTGALLFTIAEPDPASNGPTAWLTVWDSAQGKPVSPEIELSNSVAGAVLSDAGNRVVLYGGAFVQTWDLASGKPRATTLQPDQSINGAFLSRDASRLGTISGNRVQLWDAATGRPLFKPIDHRQPVSYAEFSPDANLLVVCCADPGVNKASAEIWNTTTGRPQCPPLTHRDGVLRAAFSPDSRRVVTASEDFTAIEWDARTGRRLTLPIRHKHQVGSADFSPDGEWMVTACADHTACIWSAGTGDALTPPLVHLGRIAQACFLLDGRSILVSGPEGNAWLWELPVDDRPVPDLMLLSYLLSGGSATPSTGWTLPRAASLQAIREQLRARYPSDFTVAPDEITAWHEFEAQTSELEAQWPAAAFHLQLLLALHPDDPSLRSRLARATRHLSAPN